MRDFKRLAAACFLFLAVLLVASLPYRFLSARLEKAYDPDFYTAFLKQRWRTLEEEVGNLELKNKRVLLFFGLSEVELGIDPQEIIASQGMEYTEGLNLGFRALPPDAIPVLLERVFRLLRSRGASELVLVMKVPVFSLTRQSYQFNRGVETNDFTIAVADLRSYLGLVVGSPADSANLFLKSALFGTASSAGFGYWLYQVALPSLLQAGKRPEQSLFSSKSMLEESHWPLGRRGKIPWEITAARNPSLVEAARSGRFLPETIAWYQNRYGIISPELHPPALLRLREAAAIAREYRVKTLLFQFSDLYSRRSLRNSRAETVIRELDKEAASLFSADPALDLDTIEPLSEYDFLDAMHLSESGQKKVGRALGIYIKKNL